MPHLLEIGAIIRKRGGSQGRFRVNDVPGRVPRRFHRKSQWGGPPFTRSSRTERYPLIFMQNAPNHRKPVFFLINAPLRRRRAAPASFPLRHFTAPLQTLAQKNRQPRVLARIQPQLIFIPSYSSRTLPPLELLRGGLQLLRLRW